MKSRILIVGTFLVGLSLATGSATAALPDNVRGDHAFFQRELFDYSGVDEPPQPEWIVDRLYAFGAQTQILTTPLCIHARKDVAAVEIGSFPMNGPCGDIAAEHVDVSVIRWIGKGAQDVPSPEMLMKDDRIRLRGVLTETGLLPLVRFDGPVTTSLERGRTKEFWIQTRIPADARPGNYKGTLVVRLDDTERRLPFSLEVLPIDLKKPTDVLWGIWHPPAWTDDRNWDDLTLEEQRARPLTRDVFERYVKTLADCGFNTFTTPLWDHPKYVPVCRMMQKYGMRADYNFANGTAWAYRDDGNPEAYRYNSPVLGPVDLADYTQEGVKFCRRHQVPLAMLTMEDETTDLKTIRRRTMMMEAGSGYGWACIHKNWHAMSSVLAWAIQNGGINRLDAAHAHRHGHFAAAYHQCYKGTYPGKGQRHRFGVGAWNNSADGFLPYTAMRYQNYPFHEAMEKKTFMTIYPSRYGPILPTRYVGWREGVDDYRYLYTGHLLLDDREARHAADPDKMNQLALLRAAVTRHAQAEITGVWRRELARLILQVQEL